MHTHRIPELRLDNPAYLTPLLSPRAPDANLSILPSGYHHLTIPIHAQQPLPRSTPDNLVILPRLLLYAEEGLFRGSNVPDLQVPRV